MTTKAPRVSVGKRLGEDLTVLGVVDDRARLRGPRFELSDRITVKGQPVIEIYHHLYENPVR